MLGRVLAIDPDEPHAHVSLAIVDLQRGDVEAALAHVAEARRIDPESLAFRAQHARILRRGGRPRAALDLLLPLEPAARAEPPLAREIAAAFTDLGDLDRAAEAWDHCARRPVPAALRWRDALEAADAHLRAGDRQAARHWLQVARAAAPDAPEVASMARRLDSTATP